MAAILETPAKTAREHATTRDGEPTVRLFTVDEYYQMGEAGIFDTGGQVELFEGRIYNLSPKKPIHSATTSRVAKVFERALADRATIRQQEPVRFDKRSEPEPDVAVVKPRADEYSTAHPTPADCLLLIEVSVTTQHYDREHKGRKYAAAGVLQYLLLNVTKRELEDYREPSAEGYRYRRVLSVEDVFNLVAFPEVEIKVGDLMISSE